MGMPAAKMGDMVTGLDIHIFLIPAALGVPVPTPLPAPFAGILQLNLSPNVLIMGMPAATVGSIAVNTPPHLPQGGPFSKPPTNQPSSSCEDWSGLRTSKDTRYATSSRLISAKAAQTARRSSAGRFARFAWIAWFTSQNRPTNSTT